MSTREESLATTSDVAARFGVTDETVRRWVREHRIPFIRASRRIVRFRLADVEQTLQVSSKRDK